MTGNSVFFSEPPQEPGFRGQRPTRPTVRTGRGSASRPACSASSRHGPQAQPATAGGGVGPGSTLPRRSIPSGTVPCRSPARRTRRRKPPAPPENTDDGPWRTYRHRRAVPGPVTHPVSGRKVGDARFISFPPLTSHLPLTIPWLPGRCHRKQSRTLLRAGPPFFFVNWRTIPGHETRIHQLRFRP